MYVCLGVYLFASGHMYAYLWKWCVLTKCMRLCISVYACVQAWVRLHVCSSMYIIKYHAFEYDLFRYARR